MGLSDWPDLLDRLIGGSTVRPRFGTHPRIRILGPLEARLQTADLVILGGLNEGTWPTAADADPWMRSWHAGGLRPAVTGTADRAAGA